MRTLLTFFPRLAVGFGCLYFIIGALVAEATDALAPTATTRPPPAFAKGADISWVTEMQAAGSTFRDRDGTPKPLVDILQNLGMDTIRLRVWHTPDDGWNGLADTVAKALDAKSRGMRLMIDFHYSDSWADPGKQYPPAAWANLNAEGLAQAVADHTREVLWALRDAGVTPEWVAIGNETNDGLLWPLGRASTNPANYARFVRAGYAAAKEVFPETWVMVHISNGFNAELSRWNLGLLSQHGAPFDLIALSLYPEDRPWLPLVEQYQANATDLATRFGKPVMLAEVGFRQDRPDEARAFLAAALAATRAVPKAMGVGVLYWEPQSFDWKAYAYSAWQADGTPSPALDAFREGEPLSAVPPRPVRPDWTGHGLRVTFASRIGQRYQLEDSPDLRTWQSCGPIWAGHGGWMTIDASSEAISPERLSRVRAFLP